MNVKVSNANTPVWKTVTVKSHIPEPLKKLDELAHNLWWTWNNEATALFSSLDKDLWQKVDKNPIELLTHISYKRLKEIASDEEFLARMDKVYTSFRQYMDVKPDAKRQERKHATGHFDELAPVDVLEVEHGEHAAREKAHGVQDGDGTRKPHHVRADGHREDVPGEPRDRLYRIGNKERCCEKHFLHVC